jgi:hypothetical protein
MIDTAAYRKGDYPSARIHAFVGRERRTASVMTVQTWHWMGAYIALRYLERVSHMLLPSSTNGILTKLRTHDRDLSTNEVSSWGGTIGYGTLRSSIDQ